MDSTHHELKMNNPPPWKNKVMNVIGPVGSRILANASREKVIGPTGSIVLSNGEAG